MKRLVAIDVETGGLVPGVHPLLSIAAQRADGASFHYLILPPAGAILDPDAVKKNGYSLGKWLDGGARTLLEAMRAFSAWVEFYSDPLRGLAATPVAHNAGFDRAFVDAAYRECSQFRNPLDRRWECSQATFAAVQRAGLLPEGSTSLDALCAVSGTTRDEPHDALSDARACLHGYEFLIQKMRNGEGGQP